MTKRTYNSLAETISLPLRGRKRGAKAPKTSKGAKNVRPAKAPSKKELRAAEASKPAPVKKARAKKAEAKPKKLSALNAAAQVLAAAGEPMDCKAIVEAMATQGLWSSPAGKTPHATLYAAILREIAKQGKDARFKKTDRGRFAAN
jgi:hypothetical protein